MKPSPKDLLTPEDFFERSTAGKRFVNYFFDRCIHLLFPFSLFLEF